MLSLLKALGSTYPGLVRLYPIGSSWLGHDIWVLEVAGEEDGLGLKPGVLIVGYHHARERISLEVPLYIAWRLLRDQVRNETVRGLLEDFTFYIIPALNPDGIEASEANPWHRKNLRPIDDDGDGLVDEDPPEDVDGDGLIEMWWNSSGRGFEGLDNDGDGLFNEDWPGGVDLNRNYGFHWGDPNVESGSRAPWDEDYIGPAPFSEPETRALRSFMIYHRNVVLAVSYHSGAECIIYPWTYTHAPCEDEELLRELAEAYGEVAGYPLEDEGPLGYTCSGEWGDWMYGAEKVLALTVEVYGMHGDEAWFRENTEEINGTYYFGRVWDYFNPPGGEIEEICQKNYQARKILLLEAEEVLGICPRVPEEVFILLLPFLAIPAVVIRLLLARARRWYRWASRYT